MKKTLLSLGLAVLAFGANAQSDSQFSGNGAYDANGACIEDGYVFSFNNLSEEGAQSSDSINYIGVGTAVAGGFEPTIVNTGTTFNDEGVYANGLKPSYDDVLLNGLTGSGGMKIEASDNGKLFQSFIIRMYAANGAAYNGQVNPDLSDDSDEVRNPLGVSVVSKDPTGDTSCDSIRIQILSEEDFLLVSAVGFNVIAELDGNEDNGLDTAMLFADKSWWVNADDDSSQIWSEGIQTAFTGAQEIQNISLAIDNAVTNSFYDADADVDRVVGSVDNVDDKGAPEMIILDGSQKAAGVFLGVRKDVAWNDADAGKNEDATLYIGAIEIANGGQVSAMPKKDCVVKEDETSLDKEAASYGFAIYPNPATDYVQFTHNVNGNVTLNVANALGSTVMNVTGEGFDVSSLAAGVYYATLNVNGEAKAVKRFMVK
jgi:hypothetical protein